MKKENTTKVKNERKKITFDTTTNTIKKTENNINTNNNNKLMHQNQLTAYKKTTIQKISEALGLLVVPAHGAHSNLNFAVS